MLVLGAGIKSHMPVFPSLKSRAANVSGHRGASQNDNGAMSERGRQKSGCFENHDQFCDNLY